MQDTYISDPNFDKNISLFAVFKGNSGASVARYCKRYFGAQLRKNKSYQCGEYEEALKETFFRVDEMIASEEGQEELKTLWDGHERNSGRTSSTAATVCLIVGKKVYCANVGDSSSMVWSKNQKIDLCREQKPGDEADTARIEHAGGEVVDGKLNGQNTKSRCIGCLRHKQNPDLEPWEQLVSAEPDIIIRDLTEDDQFILMGSPGFFQTLKADEICAMVERNIEEDPEGKLSGILEVLFDMSLAHQHESGHVDYVGCENMTGIIVNFKK